MRMRPSPSSRTTTSIRSPLPCSVSSLTMLALSIGVTLVASIMAAASLAQPGQLSHSHPARPSAGTPPLSVRLDEGAISERAASAVLGSFVADAAAMPLHWIYDQAQIARLVGSGAPEFHDPPSCPFYTAPLGNNTLYGISNMVVLSVGASTGGFDPRVYQSAFYALYGPATSPGRTRGYYYDASTKDFIANVAGGANWPACGSSRDTQADALAHIVPVVAVYAGNTSAMLAAAETVIRVTQDTDGAVAFGCAGARLLETAILSNVSGLEAVTRTMYALRDPARVHPLAADGALADGLQRVLGMLDTPNAAVCLAIGQSCDYPFNFWTAAHLIAQLGGTGDDYVSGEEKLKKETEEGEIVYTPSDQQCVHFDPQLLRPQTWWPVIALLYLTAFAPHYLAHPPCRRPTDHPGGGRLRNERPVRGGSAGRPGRPGGGRHSLRLDG